LGFDIRLLLLDDFDLDLLLFLLDDDDGGSGGDDEVLMDWEDGDCQILDMDFDVVD